MEQTFLGFTKKVFLEFHHSLGQIYSYGSTVILWKPELEQSQLGSSEVLLVLKINDTS